MCDVGDNSPGSNGKLFKLLNFNVQGIGNKIGLLEVVLADISADFLCLEEHWLGTDELESLRIQGYTRISAFARRSHNHGGVVILVKDHLVPDCRDFRLGVDASQELVFECAAVRFLDTLIICLYRSQLGCLDSFIARLADVLGHAAGCRDIILVGDFNVDYLRESVNLRALRDLFNSFNIFNLVNEPTRIANRADGRLSSSGLDYVVTDLPKWLLKTFMPASLITTHSYCRGCLMGAR